MPESPLRFLAASALSVLLATRAAAITADSADDVCPPDADPCEVTEVVDVVDESTLDFSTRAIHVSGNGRFDFGSGSGTILCGPFEATTRGAAIVSVGPTLFGDTGGGIVRIEARRRCSGDEPSAFCVREADCDLGACDTRRCSARPDWRCTSDSSCQGQCVNSKCSHSSSFLRCDTNADCDFGTCPEQLTCRGFYASPRNCSADTHCDIGSCSIGTASIVMNGEIDGRADTAGNVVLRAADSVSIGAPVDLSSTDEYSDAGDLDLLAATGDVTLTSKLLAGGTGLSYGGFVEATAGRDVVVTGPIAVPGGIYNGGFIELTAARDVLLQSNLNVSSRSGYGFGGALHLDAGQDVLVGNPVRPLRVLANGHGEGAGGAMWFEAGRNIRVASDVRLIATGGGSSDGYPPILTLDAEGDVDFAGRFRGGAGTSYGLGGMFEADTGGNIRIAATADIDLRGGWGGYADLNADNGNVDLAGKVRLRGLGYDASGSFYVDACRLTLSGEVANTTADASTSIRVRESMHVLPDGRLLTPTGDTSITYRAVEKPPVLEGTVVSTPVLRLEPELSGCPVCGNSEVDDGETCDDGNTNGGDGCSSVCVLE